MTNLTENRESDRQSLRTILAEIEQGINERNLDKIVNHLHDQAVVTYQNAEVSAGKDQIITQFNRYFSGPSALIKTFTIHGEVKAPAIFYGDTAVAYGITHDEMELAAGKKFVLDGTWSSTILKSGSQWKIASLHFSTNVLNNGVLNTFKKYYWIAGIVGLTLGAVITFAVSKL